MSDELPLTNFINDRCRELGLRKIDLVRRTSYRNHDYVAETPFEVQPPGLVLVQIEGVGKSGFSRTVGQAGAGLARVSAAVSGETSPNRLKLLDCVGVSPADYTRGGQ